MVPLKPWESRYLYNSDNTVKFSVLIATNFVNRYILPSSQLNSLYPDEAADHFFLVQMMSLPSIFSSVHNHGHWMLGKVYSLDVQ